MQLRIKEALRLYCRVGSLTHRLAIKDNKVGDIIIKKGDHINLLLIGLHFYEETFKDAKDFHINRFDKQNEKLIPKYQYLPFSIKKKVCLGRHLGELKVKLLVTQIIRT